MDAREAILGSGWDPRLVARRLELWRLRIDGVPMAQIAARFKISERQCWTDWKAVNVLVGSLELPKVVAKREQQAARHERLYAVTMAQIARQMGDDGKGAVDPRLIDSAGKIIHRVSELYGLVDRSLTFQMTAIHSPFVELLRARGNGSIGGEVAAGNGGTALPGPPSGGSGTARDAGGRFTRPDPAPPEGD